MSILKDLLALQNQVCFHGNQHAVILMSCNNTEETALVYGPSHLDDTVTLTKCIGNIIRCVLYCYPIQPLFSIKATDTWCLV